MLFLTASLLGLAAGMMRSAFAVAIVAVLLVGAFASATVLSSAPAVWANLLVAVLGYNCGLICLVSALVFERRKEA